MTVNSPRWQIIFPGLLLGCAMAITGCGAGGSAPSSADPGVNKASASSSPAQSNAIQVLELKTYTLDQLPAVREDEALPRLDGGRITVAPPGDWQIGSKQPKVVCRFHLEDREGPPRIIVRSESTVVGEFQDVTADNVAAYAEEVAKSLEANKQKPQENLRPLVLGDNAWVRWVKKAKYARGGAGSQDTVDVEWQVLQTVRGGRTYYVDLQVLAGKLATETAHRDAAYAVAATMKFLEPEGAEKEEK